MSITYQRETMAEALDDMRPLFPDHWKELALNQQSIKLSPDIGRYLEMERKGGLHLFTAREDGKLIGYYVSVMQTHPHYSESLMDVSDMFYLLPAHRKGWTGVGLFAALENDLRPRGVEVMMTVIKPSHNIGPMLEYLGWNLAGYVYSKCLKESGA